MTASISKALGFSSGGGSAPQPAAAPVQDQAAATDAELRKQKAGQRAVGAGVMRSGSGVDLLGATAPISRREASRKLLG